MTKRAAVPATPAGACTSITATALIESLQLQPHPEGGWWAQTWLPEASATARRATSAGNSPSAAGGAAGPASVAGVADSRPAGTAIVFLLQAGERSHWHRLDVDEQWFFHDGAPLEHRIVTADGQRLTTVLGLPSTGHAAQVHVPIGAWQSARSLGSWTLVGCSTTPGWTETGFTLAPPGWEP